MKKSVIIAAHPETKSMLTPAKKEGWSTMRVSQSTYSLSGPGGVQSRSAFITKKNEDWEILKKEFNLAVGLPISGQIIRTETRTPQYENQSPKKYPEGHPNAGEVFLVDGQPVYFQDTYVEDMTLTDTLIAKSNVVNVVKE